jgi:type III secretion system low calcium response chaperone LcrH/SycD
MAMASQSTPIDEAKLQRDAEYILFKGGSLADLRNITSDELDAVYALAYTEYGQHHFEKAEKLFTFLCLYDHRQQKHWMGLGACRQQLGQLKPAAQAFMLAGILEPDDPTPPLQLGECLLALGSLDEAARVLKLAVHKASQDQRHARIKARAEVLLNATRARKEQAGGHAG